ncbi:LolA family protein [Dinghuibacter silviterrae]|nr:outer membrane lipoprotein carrier protein LolA [Dinghuibacter silviterrae]
MKYLFTTLAIVLSSFLAVHAQAPALGGPSVQSDPDAKKLLDQVSTRFKGYQSVKAGFTLTIENADGKVDGKKTGTVAMKGTKYRISLPGQEIFCDGNNTWSYDKSSNEVKIDKVDPTAHAITPQTLLTNFYDKDYLYKLNGTVPVNGKSAQEIELTPNDKTKPFFKVLVYVSRLTKNIVSTKVFQKNGTHFTYTLNSFTPNSPAVKDEDFVFDQKKYPGVDVVDLR